MPNPPEQGDELLRMYLERQDSPCPSCGYNLRGLKGDRCPECSQGLVLRVNLTEARMGWWVAGLVGIAAGLGFSGLLLLFMVVSMFRGILTEPDRYTYLVIPGIGLGVEAVVLWFWLHRGRAIRRGRARQRGFLAVCCWLITVANFVVFASFFPG